MQKKESFTPEEKQLIWNKLNRKRIKRQMIEEPIKQVLFKQEIEKLNNINKPQEQEEAPIRGYTKEEKDKIFERINRDRLDSIDNEDNITKKIYDVNGKEYYRFLDMPRSYYIPIEILPQISSKPLKVYLYYKILGELKKREVFIKTQSYSKNLFISISTTKLNFKEYRLEDEQRD